jgi:hypothetical protein
MTSDDKSDDWKTTGRIWARVEAVMMEIPLQLLGQRASSRLFTREDAGKIE